MELFRQVIDIVLAGRQRERVSSPSLGSILCSSEFVVLQNVSVQNLEDQLREALLNPVPGKMSEDLHEYHHYLRNWVIRDLFESPLLDSVFEHVRRHFYQLFYDQYTAGSSQEVKIVLVGRVSLPIKQAAPAPGS